MANNTASPRTILETLRGWWDWLTRPSANIADPEQQRRARILSGILVGLLIFGGFSIVGDLSVTETDNFVTHAIGIIAAWFMLLAIYMASRTRHTDIVSGAILAFAMIAIYAQILSSEVDDYLLYFGLIPIYLSAIFFSARGVTVTAGVHVLGMIAFLVTDPDNSPTYVHPMTFTGMATVIVLVFMVYRNQVEDVRHGEINAALSGSEARTQVLISESPDRIYNFEPSGAIILTNHPDQTLAETSLFDHLPLEATEKLRDAIGQMVTGQHAVTYESQAPDGRWYLNRLGAVRDDIKQIQSYILTASDITERKLAEVERERLQEEIIQTQQSTLKELSTPIIPLMDQIIVLPLIGSVDTARASDIMRALLDGVTRYQAQVVIVDLTGVPVVDSGVASHLNRSLAAVRLKGAQAIVTGISAEIAETIVDLGIDWSTITTVRDLQAALMMALEMLHGEEVAGTLAESSRRSGVLRANGHNGGKTKNGR